MSSVNKNILYMLLAQLGRFVVPLITFPYLTRVLGLEHYGIFAFGLALATYMGLVTQFGFNLSAVEQVTRFKSDTRQMERVVSAVLAAQGVIFVAVSLIVAMGLWLVDVSPMTALVIVCFFPNVIGNSLLVPWLHQGIEKMANVALFIMLGRLLSIPFVFWLVNTPDDVWLAALLHAAGVLMAGLMSVTVAFRQIGIRRVVIERDAMLQLTRESYPLFITNASANMYSASVPLLVGFVSGAVSVGLYNAAQVFKNIATQLMAAIFQSIFPRSLRYYDEDRDEMKRFLTKYLKLCTALALAGSGLAIVLAPWLVVIAAGPEFAPAAPVLQVLMLSVVLGVLNNFLGVQTLIPFGFKSEFSKVVLRSGVLSLALTLPLAYLFGAIGAAVSVVLVELVICIGLVALHRKHQINVFRLGNADT